jgi:hypothetical protein
LGGGTHLVTSPSIFDVETIEPNSKGKRKIQELDARLEELTSTHQTSDDDII